MKEVLDTVKEQINYKLDQNKQKQEDILKEREEMIQKIEEYDGNVERR